MKKLLFVCLLLLAGIRENLCAQTNEYAFAELSKTDQQFTVPNEKWLRHKFKINLSANNTITVELHDKKQLEKIINLDSLLSALYLDILLLKDSFKNELSSRRFDFNINDNGKTRMRYQEFAPKGSTFLIENNEPAALKIEQDHVIINGFTKSETSTMFAGKLIYFSMPYRITIAINNIAELRGYLNNSLNKVIAKLKTDWDNYKGWTPKNNWDKRLAGTYNVFDPSADKPVSSARTGSNMPQYISPFIHVAVQNVRNLFAPSVALGIDLTRNKTGRTIPGAHEQHFQLFTELFFFYEKNANNNTSIKLNTFLTFQYKDSWNISTPKEKEVVKYYQQFSLGWMLPGSNNLSANGNYFPNHSFKLGFPGCQYRNVILSPEFYFHDFFKQFTPGLKLAVQFD